MTILLLGVEVTIVLGFSGQTDYASRLPGTKRSFRLLMLSLFPQNPVKVVGDWMERCTAAKHEVALTNSAVFFDFSHRKKKGVVMRTAAARNFDSEGSNKPSSRNYTIRKDSQPSVSITAQGIAGHYNHYRTQALSSTPDRAVSLSTSMLPCMSRGCTPCQVQVIWAKMFLLKVLNIGPRKSENVISQEKKSLWT
jgi:hypothetical protein